MSHFGKSDRGHYFVVLVKNGTKCFFFCVANMSALFLKKECIFVVFKVCICFDRMVESKVSAFFFVFDLQHSMPLVLSF